MNEVSVINIQDENAESQFAAMLKIAAMNAVLDGDCDIEDLEDLDAEGLAKSLADKLKSA